MMFLPEDLYIVIDNNHKTDFYRYDWEVFDDYDDAVVKVETLKKETEEKNKEGKFDYRRWGIVRLDEAISEMADSIDEQARDSAYSDAYSDAFDEGRSEGYEKGYREGFEEGSQESRGE